MEGNKVKEEIKTYAIRLLLHANIRVVELFNERSDKKEAEKKKAVGSASMKSGNSFSFS